MERETHLNTTKGDYNHPLNQSELKLKTETWLQDPHNQNLWHGANGIIINTEALEYREEFFEIVRKYH